jgi:hypothetical protein
MGFASKSPPVPAIQDPTTIKERKQPTAPAMSRGRLPTRSRRKTAGKVKTVLTIPYTPVARSEVVFGSSPRLAKTVLISHHPQRLYGKAYSLEHSK